MRQLPPMAVFLLAAVLALPAKGQAPPPETTERLEAAFHALDAEHFAGTFMVTTKSVVAKPGGKDREDGLEVWRLTVRPGEEPGQELLRAEENGQDVTAERRAKQEKEHERSAKKRQSDDDTNEEEGGTFSAFLKLPMGDDLAFYSFGAPARDGELVVASFAPLAAHRKKDGMALGRLAWRGDTLDPVWIEAQPTNLPRGAKELSLRFELARQAELLYIGRTVTDGIGGILWIKREFHVDVEIGDVLPGSGSGT